ncbi:Aminotransferase class V [Candidatus Zixiibacteriota bacterium]|nr:Aminotransferase class V [candidate division Zixibacteria bacterium]
MEKKLAARFKAARRLFPVTEKERKITYFNSASTGPLCRPVKKAMYDYYELTQYLEKSAIDREAFAALDTIRSCGARILGAAADEVGFGFSTTFGLNIAAFGLPLKKGDEVLLSDVEFPANVYPWLALGQNGVKVRMLKSVDRHFDIEIFEKSIGPKTRCLALSFVQFFNGYKNDLEEIGKICRRKGLYFVVDGIQGCGVETIDVRKCRIDILSSGAQKWMLSPLGTGLFYIRKDLQKKVRMPFASWLGVDWKLNFTDLFHYDLPFFNSARRFEMGTYPYGHVFAAKAALELITSLGVANIQKHNHELLDTLIEYLNESGYYRVVSSLEAKHRSSILSFTCPEARDVYKRLAGLKIIASFREGAIRISPHLFNDSGDIRRFIGVLKSAQGN